MGRWERAATSRRSRPKAARFGSAEGIMRPWLRLSKVLLALMLALGGVVPATSGVHLWRVKEVFSNASGTIQFIEIATCCGSTGENFTNGHHVTSNTGGDFMITANTA